MKPRIYADFQKLDEQGRAILSCFGSVRDLGGQSDLVHGLAITLYSDDLDDDDLPDELRVDAVLEWAAVGWVARFDSSAFRHASDDMKTSA